jgi:rsbT co-antagonist protein RsbR
MDSKFDENQASYGGTAGTPPGFLEPSSSSALVKASTENLPEAPGQSISPGPSSSGAPSESDAVSETPVEATAEYFVREFGLSAKEVERRLAIIGLVDEDRARIRTLAVIIGPRARELTAAFFVFLSSHKDGGFIVDLETLETASRLKVEHLLAMVKADYGLDYVEERLKLATLYAGAGVDPRFFLAAYSNLVRTIGDLVMEHHRKDPDVGFAAFESLMKVAFFDLSLIVDVIVFERERIIRQQQEAIRELSTPALPVREGLLILPMIGIIDSQRSRQLTDNLLKAIRKHRARVVVMDITGVPSMDHDVASRLFQTVTAARLTGARLVVSGISAQVSQALVSLGVDVSGLDTYGDLRGAIEEAERVLGYTVQRVDGRLMDERLMDEQRLAGRMGRSFSPS